MAEASGVGVAFGLAAGLACASVFALGSAAGVELALAFEVVLDVALALAGALAFAAVPAFLATGLGLGETSALAFGDGNGALTAGGPSTTPTTCGASGPSVKSHENGACGGTCTGTSEAITSRAAVAMA